MKSKYVVLASALLISVASFAQKDEMKAAEKAFKKGNSQEAATILQGAESLISNASDDEKAQFFFLKGNTYLDLANKKVDTDKNLSLAADAYLSLVDVEKASGKSKYSSQATASITDVKNKLLNNAGVEGDNKNFKNASKLVYLVYSLDKTDLEKLYFAATYAAYGEDYENSLAYYNELISKKYSGEETAYFAVNVVTEKEDFFGTTEEAKKMRDSNVKMKIYSSSRDEKKPSKRGEIYKNVSLILIRQGKVDEAIAAISVARKENPDDTSLIREQANLYLETKDFVTYKKLIAEVLEKSPNDAELVYNLAVISYNAKDFVEAEKYYKKAIEIKPDYIDAYLNLAILKLDGDKVLYDEQVNLGLSDKDTKRYLVLKTQREGVFRGALPYLEKANELNPKNKEVVATLLSVYRELKMTAEKKALEAKME
jgi:tetratricopeptide (TPR) repeat protein